MVRNFREALWLPGWSDRSIWGYVEQMDTFFAQLWRDGDVNDDPTMWISGSDPIDSVEHLAAHIAVACHWLLRKSRARHGRDARITVDRGFRDTQVTNGSQTVPEGGV